MNKKLQKYKELKSVNKRLDDDGIELILTGSRKNRDDIEQYVNDSWVVISEMTISKFNNIRIKEKFDQFD